MTVNEYSSSCFWHMPIKSSQTHYIRCSDASEINWNIEHIQWLFWSNHALFEGNLTELNECFLEYLNRIHWNYLQIGSQLKTITAKSNYINDLSWFVTKWTTLTKTGNKSNIKQLALKQLGKHIFVREFLIVTLTKPFLLKLFKENTSDHMFLKILRYRLKKSNKVGTVILYLIAH